MKTTESKIALACFIGAFIGSVIAFTIRHNFWWVGMLVGGLVGYLSYNMREVWEVSRKVWGPLISWRCDWKGLRQAMVGGCFVTAVLSTFFGGPLLSFWFGQPLVSFIEFGIDVSVVLFLFFVAGTFLSYHDSLAPELRCWAKHANPISASCWIVYWFIKGTAWCVQRTPRAVMKAVLFACRFVKEVFILIHSDIRLLCGVDAPLRVLAGRMVGQGIATSVPAILVVAVFGGIIGALLGILNYRLISIRWLKLVPAKP